MSRIDEQIKEWNDDAEIGGEDAGISTDSCFNNVVTYPTSDSLEYRCFGNRFQINIPKNATIHAAYWEGYIYSDILDDIACDIYGNLVGNAHHFGSMAEGGWPFIWRRPRTNASVEWVEDGLGTGWHYSPELKTIIQELVNQDDWVANNYLALLFIAKVQETIKRAIFHSWNAAIGGVNLEHGSRIHIEFSAIPSKVTKLVAGNIADRSFRLSWAENPPAEEISSYRVYLRSL